MLRRLKFHSICFAFGLSVLIIIKSQYADNTYYRPSIENRRNIKNSLNVKDGHTDTDVSTVPYNGSPDIRKLLEKTRSKIKYQLSKYNFTQSGVHVLEDLLMESGGQPLRSLIISTWRSGTTFLGELLNAVPGTYYHYEPLLKYGIIQIRGPPKAEQALSDIKNMFKCNYEGMEDYFTFKIKDLHQEHQFHHNTRLWDTCKIKKDLCFDADFTSRLCKLFPFQTMKVVHLRLRLIQEILDDKELNVKVILLIRDPRGVMASRRHQTFCKSSPDCWDPSLLCADMISDYVAAGRILQQYPEKLMVLRYEELALKPNITTLQILKFLRLGAVQSVYSFLQSHMNVEAASVFSTFRVSREVPFKWNNELDFNYVDEIQMTCEEAMLLWGYKMAHNQTDMSSKEFNPMKNYTI